MVAPGNLGRRVRIVELVEDGRREDLKNDMTELMTSWPTMPQAAL